MVRSIAARAKLALAFCRPARREGSAEVFVPGGLDFAPETGDTVTSIGCAVSNRASAFGAFPLS